MTSRDAATPRAAPDDCHGDIQHEKGGFTMRPRTFLLFALAALMGAAVAVLPALAAGPSEEKLEVNENCLEIDWPCWTHPGGSPSYTPSVAIASGGVVAFSDEMGEATNIKWTSTPSGQPTCSSEVPVSPTPAKTGWEGTCKFEQPGTYKFESPLFNDGITNYTKYEIVVGGASTGTTSTTTTTTTTPTATTPTTTTPTTTTPTTTTPKTTPTATTPTATTSTQPYGGVASTTTTPGPTETPPPPGGTHPLATLALANAQHGDAVHGTVQIPAADGGARLEVELLAQGALPAKVKRPGSLRVGRLVRSSAPAGKVSFTVSLDAAAKSAVHRHHKLALTVKIVLTPKHGAVVTLTRSVVVR
jgi:cell division septation protein DedD